MSGVRPSGMLTGRQKALYDFIVQRITERDVPPSYDEMKLELGLRSKSGIHRMIVALEQRGFIRRMPNYARAIEVVGLTHEPRIIRATLDVKQMTDPAIAAELAEVLERAIALRAEFHRRSIRCEISLENRLRRKMHNAGLDDDAIEIEMAKGAA